MWVGQDGAPLPWALHWGRQVVEHDAKARYMWIQLKFLHHVNSPQWNQNMQDKQRQSRNHKIQRSWITKKYSSWETSMPTRKLTMWYLWIGRPKDDALYIFGWLKNMYDISHLSTKQHKIWETYIRARISTPPSYQQQINSWPDSSGLQCFH